MNHIKQRLRTEPPRLGRPHRLISKRRVGIIDLDRRPAAARSRRISQQLRVAALLEADEPEHRLFDGATHREQAVILEEGGLAGAQRGGNVFAFFGGEDDAVELFVEDVVLSSP